MGTHSTGAELSTEREMHTDVIKDRALSAARSDENKAEILSKKEVELEVALVGRLVRFVTHTQSALCLTSASHRTYGGVNLQSQFQMYMYFICISLKLNDYNY